MRPANRRFAGQTCKETGMKVLLWIIAIIFLIGLLVVFGLFSLIF